MTILTGTQGNDILLVEEDVTEVDGLDGNDDMRVYFYPPSFPDPTGPQTYFLTQDRLYSLSGSVDFTFANIENVDLRFDNPELVTVDASGFVPASTQDNYPLQIYAYGGVSDITGSAYGDAIYVFGADNTVDGCDGFDLAYAYAEDPASQFTIAADGNFATVMAEDGAGGEVSLLRATNVERISVRIAGGGAGFTEFSVDASQAPVGVNFFDAFTDDTFVGSAFDDLFIFTNGSSTGTNIVTGGEGADIYFFGTSLRLLDATTITDFEPGDIVDLDRFNFFSSGLTTFIGTAEFSGAPGEYRYFTDNGETFIQVDLDGRGTATSTLTIANGEFELEKVDNGEHNHALWIAGYVLGDNDDNVLIGTDGDDSILGYRGADLITGGLGDDSIDGGSNIDTAIVSGHSSRYTVTQTSNGIFRVSGPDGTDSLTNVEYLQFGNTTIRLLPGTGVSVNFEAADPSVYQAAMENIRDFDGNALGGDGSWLRIGSADVDGDGDIDQILVNRDIGRFATVGGTDDGLFYFDDYSWAGETRVVGIYIDPLVESGDVVAGSDQDSQRRFQNDLQIENINRVLGADDYDGDGLQEVYFALTDGTAYLHAYMHADGNIRYANYQSEQEVIDFLTANGYDESTWADWFPSTQEEPGADKSEEATTLLQPEFVDVLYGRSSDSAPFLAQQFEMGLYPPVENLA